MPGSICGRAAHCVLLLSVLIAACPLARGADGATDASSARAHVASGELIGALHEGVARFAGIPYAAPPVGELRWRPPQPPVHWPAPRDATVFGPSCAQAQVPARVQPGAERLSEDCLTLNVWAPADTTTTHPVMVWIHGGGNTAGTGANAFYDGTAFARDGVILVTLNYRLGLLGFFAHPALTHEARQEPFGNYALMDQIAALQWVRRNIASFGGDPGNVTVFGESAGALDILALMASDAARKTFDKAIVESAGIWSGWPTLASAEGSGTQIAKHLGLPAERATARELRRLSVEALTGDLGDRGDLGAGIGMGPIIDGRLLREPPPAAFARHRAAAVPLIIGSNNDEGSLLGAETRVTAALPEAAPSELMGLRTLYGTDVGDDAGFARALFRDAHFAAPARWIASHAAPRAPAYLYRFDYVMSLLRGRRSGANHGSEIPFVFDSWMAQRLSDEDRRLTALVHACWIAFAKSGAPSCAGAVSWTPYQPDHDTQLVFGDPLTMRTPAHAALLDALAQRVMPFGRLVPDLNENRASVPRVP